MFPLRVSHEGEDTSVRQRNSHRKNAFRRTRWVYIAPVALLMGAIVPGLTLRNRPALEQLLLGELLTGLSLSALLLLGVAFLVSLKRGPVGSRSRDYIGIALAAVLSTVMITRTVQSGLALLSPIKESEGQVLRAERKKSSKGGGALIWHVRLQTGEVIKARTFDDPIVAQQRVGQCVLVRYVAHTDFAQVLPCGGKQ